MSMVRGRRLLAKFFVASAAPFGMLVLVGSLLGADPLAAGIAYVLCAILAAIGIEFTVRAFDRGFNWQLAAVLGGSFVRMFAALGFAGALYLLSPVCHSVEFWVWMGLAYLITLVVDVALTLAALKEKQLNLAGV